uniref:Putative secreted protein n=1 Tax=Ixodes ricinus TaxID=34613 RepID=A0A6B0V4J9_IXORI
MFQSYILNIPIYVLLLLQCHINGAKGYGGVESYQNFMEEFVKVVHQEVHKSLNTSMYHVHLPAYLVTVSGKSINLGADHLARIFGLSFKFGSDGSCIKRKMTGKNTLHCPVKFEDLLIQLPLLDFEETVYVVHVTIKGTLVFLEGTNRMHFQRLILLYEHYEIMDSDGKPVNPPPAAYCLKAKSPLGLKGILQNILQNIIENGVFKNGVKSSLEKIQKPKDISDAKTNKKIVRQIKKIRKKKF